MNKDSEAPYSAEDSAEVHNKAEKVSSVEAVEVLKQADEVLLNNGLETNSTDPLVLNSNFSQKRPLTSRSEAHELAAAASVQCAESSEENDPILAQTKQSPVYEFSSSNGPSSLSYEDPEGMCCIHIHRIGTPPPDGKCCYHRCRPNWTREQRARNYGEYELLSLPNFNHNPNGESQGLKNC